MFEPHLLTSRTVGEEKPKLSSPPLLNGFLRKLGDRGIKTFKKRYFRQSGTKVSYYESENNREDQSKGYINLDAIKQARRSTTHQNAFELETKDGKRTYILQVCEVGDSVELWIDRWNRWLDFMQESFGAPSKPIPTSSSSTSYSSSASGSFKVSLDYLKVSSMSVVDSLDSSVDLTSEIPDDQIAAMLSIAESETAALTDQLTQLKVEVEQLDQEYKAISRLKEHAIERAKTGLEEETAKIEKKVTDAHKSLIEADSSLLTKERQAMKKEHELDAILSDVDFKERYLKGLVAEVEILKREISGLESNLLALKDSESSQSSDIPHALKSSIDQYSLLFNKHMQLQGSIQGLSRDSRILDIAVQSKQESQSNSDTKLKKNINLQEDAVNTIKKELAQSQHVGLEILEELEDLRQKYFFSLTVMIKLQGEVTGMKPQVDLSDMNLLYQTALGDVPDHLDWQDWLFSNLFPGTPKSQIIGRRRP